MALSDNLVAFWPLAEGTGIPVGVGPGGTPPGGTTNAMTWSAGAGYLGGYALSGTGTQAWTIPIAAGSPMDITGAGISYGAWIKPSNDSNYQLIMNRTDGTNRNYSGFLTASNTSSIYVSSVPAGINQGVDSSPGWTIGAWNHVMITIAISGGSSTSLIYLNGVNTGGFTIGSATNFASLSGTSLIFGNDGSFNLVGSIDLPAVWSRVLSGAEIASFYANPLQLVPVGSAIPAAILMGGLR